MLIVQKFASLGGSQVSLAHQLAEMDRSRFDPYVVLSNEGWLTDRLDELGVSWELLKFGHWTNVLSLPMNLLRIGRLKRVIREQGISLVHSNEHWVGPLAYYAARLSRVPVVCHFRTGLEDLTPRRIRKYLYGSMDRVIVVAEVLRKALASHVTDPSRIVVVRDGVEPRRAPFFHAVRRRKVAINVGALYDVKGQAKILDRAVPWLKADTGHYLVFVGGMRTSPPYVEAMKRTVAKNGLERQVRFLGSRNDVPRLLDLADVLIAYSTVEGVPRVVMEAMFAGRPVIVSSTPGMDEVVVDGQTGRILDFDGADNPLAAALHNLTLRPLHWQAMGRQAYEQAISRYSTRAMTSAIEAVYQDVLEQRAHVSTDR